MHFGRGVAEMHGHHVGSAAGDGPAGMYEITGESQFALGGTTKPKFGNAEKGRTLGQRDVDRRCHVANFIETLTGDNGHIDAVADSLDQRGVDALHAATGSAHRMCRQPDADGPTHETRTARRGSPGRRQV